MPRPWLVGLGCLLLIGTISRSLNQRLQRLERHAVLNTSDLCVEFTTLQGHHIAFAGATGPTIILQALPCHIRQEARQ
mgnify:CR=1 FL=1